jgi:hypothetical protein
MSNSLTPEMVRFFVTSLREVTGAKHRRGQRRIRADEGRTDDNPRIIRGRLRDGQES